MNITRDQRKHAHVEAFALMTYESNDGRIVELLWNSRDGVTPFCIRSKDGMHELRHVNWRQDRYTPDHSPQPGDRIFIDMTPEAARAYAEKRVEAHWEDGTEYQLSNRFGAKEEAISMFVSAFLQHEGAPDIVTVQP